MRPTQMRAENPPAVLFDERLVTVHRFADAPRGVPLRHPGRIHAQLRCLLTCLSFGEANGRDRREREGDAGNATIVRALTVAFENIGRDDLPVMARYRRQRRSLGGGITGCIDRRIGDALQKLVQDDSPVFDTDPGRSQVEGVEIGCTAGGMNYEISVNGDFLAPRAGAHAEAAARTLDCLDRRASLHLNANFRELLHEPAYELRVKARKHALRSLQHGHLRTRARRDVRKFGRDVAATGHDDPLRQILKLHKGIAGDGVLRTVEAERDRARTTGNHDVTTFEHAAFDYERVRASKAGKPMKGINALFGKTLLALFRYGTGDGPLEGDQLFPVDAQFAKDSAPMHPSRLIDCFGPADQHFLRIAAAQRASSAKGTMVNYRQRLARAADARGNHLRGGAGADDNDVVAVHSLSFPTLLAVQYESGDHATEDQRRNEHVTSLGKPGG